MHIKNINNYILYITYSKSIYNINLTISWEVVKMSDLDEEYEEDVYSNSGVDLLEDSDEISSEEAAFMRGWNEAM